MATKKKNKKKYRIKIEYFSVKKTMTLVYPRLDKTKFICLIINPEYIGIQYKYS